MRLLAEVRPVGPRIVETGTIRAKAGRDADGWSSIAFSWLASELGGRLWTVDVDAEALGLSRKLTSQWDSAVEHVEADSVAFLGAWDVPRLGTIDLLYLDSLDYVEEEKSEAHCLGEVQAAFTKLSTEVLVLIDDTWFVGPPSPTAPLRRVRGKGARAVPWLLEHGFDLTWCTMRQALLVRKDSRGRAPALEPATPRSNDDSVTPRTLRILWSSNAPWCSTGYGVQTRLFAPRLKRLGFDLAIHGFAGLDGGTINWEGIPQYPGGAHPFGQDILAAHAAHFKADLVIVHTDAWVIDHDLLGRNLRVVPWFPVDSDPIPDQVADRVRRSWRAITFSRFGQRKAAEVGLDVAYVPLGVDTSVYKPMDRRDARERCGMPPDAFVVGMVAMNKEVPSRKGFPQMFQAFAEFQRRHRDALLYLHTQPRGIGGKHGLDLVALAAAHGIENRVHFAPEYVVLMGARDSEMAAFYNALDVLVLPSMGEGFGTPIVEAQACGRPVIVGGWTSMPEICFAGVQIPMSEADPYWTVLQSYQFVPRIGAIVEALETVWARQGRPGFDEATAREGAVAFDVDRVVDQFWLPLLGGFQAEILMEPGTRVRSYGSGGCAESTAGQRESSGGPA